MSEQEISLTPENPLILDFNDGGGEHRFSNIQSALEWVTRERNSWVWLIDRPAGFEGANDRKPYHFFENHWGQIEESLKHERLWFDKFRTICYEKFRDEKNLIHSRSQLGLFLFQEKETSPDRAAWSVLLWTQKKIDLGASGRPCIAPLAMLHGIYRAFATVDGYQASPFEMEALKKLHADSHTVLERQLDLFQKEQHKWHGHDQHLTSVIDEWKRTKENSVTEHAALVDAHEKEMEEIRQRYTDKMALKAPVEYWQKRSEKMREKEKYWGRVAAGAGVVAAIALPVIGYCMTSLSNKVVHDLLMSDTKDYSLVGLFAQIMIPGILRFAFIAAITIWALRIVVRNYLSYSHLATDAEEREMLIQTYLSLIKDDDIKVSKDLKDQILPQALQTIFRHSADGLVKDDAMPVIPVLGFDPTRPPKS